MLTLLMILLHLCLVTGHRTYDDTDIMALERQHEPAITTIEQNPQLMAGIEQHHRAEAESIIIIINHVQE